MYRKLTLSLLAGLISSQKADVFEDGPPRIVGGYEVNPKFRYPFMVSIQFKGGSYCGGALYDETTVITAAHCSGEKVSDYSVVLHRHNLTKTSEEEKGIIYKVNKIIIHPEYEDVENDIAVWKLERSYGTSTKKLIDLDVDNLSSKAGTLTKVIGWGDTSDHGEFSPVLREVKVPIFDIKKCVQNYKKIKTEVNATTMVCAGVKEGGKDSCQGDSGGPMFVEKYGRYVLLGVVSWGEGCAKPNLPGVYAKVHTYIKWIKQQL